MINLVFCIKSRESFKRITNTLKIDNNFELEDFTPNLETLQDNIIIKDFDSLQLSMKNSPGRMQPLIF